MTTNSDAANDECGLLEILGGSEGGCGAGADAGAGAGACENGAAVEEVTVKKGPWTAAEDAILVDYVTKNGEGNWNAVQRNTGLARCGKSCRLRWANHLRPNLKKGAFSPEEEKLILELHAQYGNKWARMATLLPGRTDNEIKNYWNTRVKRRQRQGLPLYGDGHDQPTTPTTPTTPSTPVTPTGPNTSTATKFEFLHRHHHPVSPTSLSHSPLSSPLGPKPAYSPHPFLEPTPFSASSSTSPISFTFQRPIPVLCSPLSFKRFGTSTPASYSLLVPPIAPGPAAIPDHPVATQLADLDGFRFPIQMNSDSSQNFQNPLGTNRGITSPSVLPTKLELPSNQYSQFSHPMEPETKFNMEMNNPALQTNGGLLGDLPMEAQAMASGQTSKKRNYLILNEGNDLLDGYRGFDDLPLHSVYWSSTSAGLKPKEEAAGTSKLMNEDLSALHTAMPSAMQVPDWNSGSANLVSNVQSSSFIPEDYFGLDIKPIPSLFPISTTANHNEDPGCYSWDNLPGFC